MSPLGFLSICGGTRSTVLSYFFIYLLFVAVFFSSDTIFTITQFLLFLMITLDHRKTALTLNNATERDLTIVKVSFGKVNLQGVHPFNHITA